MTTTSQNGWVALDGYSDPRLRRLGGMPGSVRDCVHPVFEYLVSEFARRVEPINEVRDDWAFSPRNIAGTSVISNHASGTAIDLNATKHPQFARGTFTDAQVREIRAVLAELDGVVEWGGDWGGRADEMHFEIADAAPEAKVIGMAARLAAPIAARQATTVTVAAGDGWWQTARKAGVSMDALLAANGASVRDEIHPGQKLKVA